VYIDSSGGAFAPTNVVTGNSVIGNVISGNGPDYDFANPQPTAIAVISPTSVLQEGTVVTGNYILNEYYGLAVANATGETILSNNIATTVNVPIFGAIASPNPISSLNSTLNGQLAAIQSSINQLQSSAAKQSDLNSLSTTVNNAKSQAQTATYVAYAAIAVAIVFGGIAIGLSMRKPAPARPPPGS